MRFCWQLCCGIHRSSHCMGKLPEFVFLVNGLQKWASWRFLDAFIFVFLVRCPVDRGFEAFLFVSSPILLGERGTRHIRVWGQTHSYQLPDALESGSCCIRIWEQTRSNLGRRSLGNIRRGLGEAWIEMGRFL